MAMLPKKLSDEDVVKLRGEKIELNRASRRQLKMKTACRGKSEGVLECQTPEGTCPDYAICHEGQE